MSSKAPAKAEACEPGERAITTRVVEGEPIGRSPPRKSAAETTALHSEQTIGGERTPKFPHDNATVGVQTAAKRCAHPISAAVLQRPRAEPARRAKSGLPFRRELSLNP